MRDVPVVADPARLRDLAVDLATDAAALVRASTGERLRIGAKSTDTDLVTSADRAAEQRLVQRLAAERPDDAVLGEEGGGRPGTSGVRWVLDPVDGTVNFVLGIPAYAVSVAAEVDGRVVAGAVCNVATGECFEAVAGGGARLGAHALHGPRGDQLAAVLRKAAEQTADGEDAKADQEHAAAAEQIGGPATEEQHDPLGHE